MCFNETASLVAFSIGVLSTMVLLHMKLYKFSIFYISVILVQLIEYYAHKSLSTNNINMNKISSYFIYFLTFLQPIILSYLSFNDIHKNSQNTLIILCLAYIIYAIYVFVKTYKSKQFKISCVQTKYNNSVCRLNWDFLFVNFYNGLMMGLFYFGISSFVAYNRKSDNISILTILVFLLGLTFLYITNENKKLHVFSSLWCFICVTAGPLVIMNKNLTI